MKNWSKAVTNHRRSNWGFVLALLAIVLLLAACGRATTPPAEATSEPAVAPTAEPTPAPTTPPPTTAPTQEAEAPAVDTSTPTVLTVGINLEFRPFVFKDENGNLAGFDIDLINALAAAGNFEIAYVETPFDGIFERLNAGEYDAVISAITVTAAREELIDFTDVYFQSGQAVVSYFSAGQGLATRVDDTAIQGVESLNESVRVGVKQGTTGDTFASEETSAEIVRYPEASDAVAALLAGEVDAVVLDVAVLAKAITDSGQIKLVGPPVTEEEYAIAVAEGDTATRDLLNTALAEIRQSGVYDQLVQRWFGSP